MVLFFIFLAATYTGFKYTSKSDSCAICHVMQPNYLSWLKSPHYSAGVQCVDCHLPEQMSQKIYFKSKLGLNDIFRALNGQTDLIQANSDTKNIVNANCLRCHRNKVTKSHASKFQCSECHRFAAHN